VKKRPAGRFMRLLFLYEIVYDHICIDDINAHRLWTHPSIEFA
jgi:hypothetical protein